MKTIKTQDVFAAVVPAGVDPSDQRLLSVLLDRLTDEAHAWIAAQWTQAPRPTRVELDSAHWTVTNQVEEVEEFQPAHDCEECRAGNETSKAFLLANPGRWIALANVTYTEYWDD